MMKLCSVKSQEVRKGLLCFFVLVHIACSGQVANSDKVVPRPLQNTMSEQFLEDHLIKSQPRLVLNAENEKILRNKLTSDPVVRNVYEAIRLNAEKIFEKRIINLDTPLAERTQNNQLDISREMLYRMNMLAMTYRMDRDPKVLQRIDEEVIAACNFPTWNPRHFLDVGEMAMAIALALDWTAGELPPATIDLAKESLIEKGIKPSWPEGGDHSHWAYGSNNWNQVCNGGMVAAALTIAEVDPALAARTLHRAIDGMVYALAEYGPDGVYPEGSTYWGYGTSFSVMTAAMLESALGTDFGMMDYPGFKESAVFRLLSNGPTGLVFNFADCGERRSENGDMTLAFFASKTGNGTFFERDRFLRPAQEMGKISRMSGAALVWLSQFEEKMSTPLPTTWKGSGTNPVVFFTGGKNNSRQYYFGGKGGRGNLSHGNMDAGSFVFDLDGVRWVLDPGNYRSYGPIERTGFDLWKRCQECDRWKLLNKNNFGHSTLSVNDQLHRVDGQADIVEYKAGEIPQATIDMTATFGGLLKSAYRTFIKDGPISLVILDSLVTSTKTELITWQLITQADVEVFGNVAKLSQDGKHLDVEILSHSELTFSVISLDPPPMFLDTKKPGLKRIEIRIPAWTISEGVCNLKVRLSGD